MHPKVWPVIRYLMGLGVTSLVAVIGGLVLGGACLVVAVVIWIAYGWKPARTFLGLPGAHPDESESNESLARRHREFADELHAVPQTTALRYPKATNMLLEAAHQLTVPQPNGDSRTLLQKAAMQIYIDDKLGRGLVLLDIAISRGFAVAEDRKVIEEPNTVDVAEARFRLIGQRIEARVQTKPRVGIDATGSTLRGKGWKIRNQDTGIRAKDSDIDVDDLDVK